jgi:hypothetical protein
MSKNLSFGWRKPIRTFIYNIQNLLELNESFIEREPNFIASIDLSTGFFQMKMSPDSSKYTAATIFTKKKIVELVPFL